MGAGCAMTAVRQSSLTCVATLLWRLSTSQVGDLVVVVLVPCLLWLWCGSGIITMQTIVFHRNTTHLDTNTMGIGKLLAGNGID